jgi:hypothetical protein
MNAAHYLAYVKEVVPKATDGSVDPEDFVLVLDGPHKNRVGFVQQIRDDGFLIIREPPIPEEHSDNNSMSVDSSPPPDDSDSRSAEQCQERLPVSVRPPLLTTRELIFDQALFEISRQFVVVYKGVQVNDTIQVTQGPMINRPGIVEKILDDGFLAVLDPMGITNDGVVSPFATRSFLRSVPNFSILQSERIREIRNPPPMRVYLETLASR